MNLQIHNSFLGFSWPYTTHAWAVDCLLANSKIDIKWNPNFHICFLLTCICDNFDDNCGYSCSNARDRNKKQTHKACSWFSKVDRPFDHSTSEQTNISQDVANNAGRDYISNCPLRMTKYLQKTTFKIHTFILRWFQIICQERVHKKQRWKLWTQRRRMGR